MEPLQYPKFLNEHIHEPPVVMPKTVDLECISLIKTFGRAYNYGMEEVEFQCALAAGYSDIVVLLDKPSTWFDPQLSVLENIDKIPTLKALDDLLRLVTRGARSIHCTTIINRWFKRLTPGDSPAQEAYGLLVKSLLTRKSPRVVLWCGDKEGTGEFCKKMISGQSYCEEIKVSSDFTALVVKTLHPCRPFFHHRFNPRLMLVTMFDFATALAGLGSGPIRGTEMDAKRNDFLKTTE